MEKVVPWTQCIYPTFVCFGAHEEKICLMGWLTGVSQCRSHLCWPPMGWEMQNPCSSPGVTGCSGRKGSLPGVAPVLGPVGDMGLWSLECESMLNLSSSWQGGFQLTDRVLRASKSDCRWSYKVKVFHKLIKKIFTFHSSCVLALLPLWMLSKSVGFMKQLVWSAAL